MPTTRAFRSGNSQAIRIPADMAYSEQEELTVSRCGDVITLVPARLGLREAVARLRNMPKPPDVEIRDPIEVPDRPGL